jgi:hypothetical protein
MKTLADWKSNLVLGGPEDAYEVSICRKSFSHGFQSWGWDGDNESDGGKHVLFTVGDSDDMPDALRAELWALRWDFAALAKRAAEAMNAVEQKARKSPATES